MMKNQLAGLMKQAQQMQDNMKKMQDELALVEVEDAAFALEREVLDGHAVSGGKRAAQGEIRLRRPSGSLQCYG